MPGRYRFHSARPAPWKRVTRIAALSVDRQSKRRSELQAHDATVVQCLAVEDRETLGRSLGPCHTSHPLPFVAGDVDPMVMLSISGYFRATYGSSIDLFASLSHPDCRDASSPPTNSGSSCRPRWQESAAGRFDAAGMTTAILKQVLVTLVRRSLDSTSAWLERFSIRVTVKWPVRSPIWWRYHRPICASVHGLGAEGHLEPVRIHGALCARNRMFANGRAPANADEACSRHARRENIFS